MLHTYHLTLSGRWH